MVRLVWLLGLLALVYFGGRWYTRLPPERKRRVRHGAGAGLVGVGLLGLVLTGRLHWLAIVLAPIAWVAKGLLRLLPQLPLLHRLWQQARGKNAGQEAVGGQGSGPEGMTPERARSILDVSNSAGPEEIVEAHRRLIRRVHPDTGGSTYLASQINQARDVLLGR